MQVTNLKANKKRLRILLGVFFWAALLVFLTHLVAAATGRSLQSTEVDTEIESHQVIFHIDEVYLSENIFRDTLVAGWAFIENEGDNPDKQINLLLVSPERTYLVETTTIDRFDLRIASLLDGLDVPISRNGFEGNFSPLTMKNGTYHLYLQVIENEDLAAINDTGKIFVKHSNKFEENFGGQEITLNSNDINPKVKINTYFSCKFAESGIAVEGWAFVEESGIGSLPSRPVVKLTRAEGSVAYFTTVAGNSFNVAKQFDNKELMRSGFSSIIPLDYLENGENIITILFEGLGESTFSCVLP